MLCGYDNKWAEYFLNDLLEVFEMAKKQISYNDLMHECGYEDEKEFKDILRHNNFQVNRKKMVEKDMADKIVKRLTNRYIEWYKYKQKQKDSESGGPIRRQNDPDIIENLANWYKRMDVHDIGADCILGIIANGGFLIGQERTEFFLPLATGVNILIGQRGTGKSTVLNLCSAVTPSTTQSASALVTSLLAAFNNDSVDSALLGRELRNRVRRYGVTSYACFYRINGTTKAIFIDLEQERYAMALQSNDTWTLIEENPFSIPLPIQMLTQGEVQRISEPDNEFYFSNILDALNPELLEARTSLTSAYAKLMEYQLTNAKISRCRWISYTEEIRDFIRTRFSELNQFKNAISSDYKLSSDEIQTISEYIYQYQQARNSIPISITSLQEIFNYGISGLWVYFIEPIFSALNRFIENIDFLNEDISDLTKLEFISNQLISFAEKEGIPPPRKDNPFGAKPYSQSSYFDNMDSHEKSNEIIDPSIINTKYLMYLQSRQIHHFLAGRLSATRYAIEIFTAKRIEWNESVLGLCNSYKELLYYRISVYNKQKQICDEATKRINKNPEYIRISCDPIYPNKDDLIQLDENIRGLDKAYSTIKKATVLSTSFSLRHNSKLYDKTTDDIYDNLEKLQTEITEKHPPFIFFPVKIELQQGNVWRIFDQLSFGQKSGIILRLVITGTKARILIIDQPEDNLDASAIRGLLIPAFTEFLEGGRQIILATHNSQLALGLKEANIIVMESVGDNGRVKLSGFAYNNDVVSALLDVLEGGVASFNTKLRTFEEFVNRLQQRIRDMDIMMIESSFRRRTIDDLRNILQPAISDQELLSMLRHELRQAPLEIHQNLTMTKSMAENLAIAEPAYKGLTTEVENLCSRLEKHIKHLQSAIEDLRLMDTDPQKKYINILDAIKIVANNSMEQVVKPRVDFHN